VAGLGGALWRGGEAVAALADLVRRPVNRAAGQSGHTPTPSDHRPGRHLITAHSDKERAAATFKKGYGFHPLGAWLANTTESLAILLRVGNVGSNTFTDHAAVLGAALRQIPWRMRSRLLVRLDGAGASHELFS
jgi:hypothetical protein